MTRPSGAGAPREWPGWKLDHKTAAHWAPLVTAAVTGALPPAKLHHVASDYLIVNPAQVGSAPGKRDRNTAAGVWLGAWLAQHAVNLTPGAPVTDGIVTDGSLIGAVSAAALVNGEAADTGGWEPGDTEEARHRVEELGAGAALTTALRSSSDVGDYVAGGYVTELARVLAGIDSDAGVSDLADALTEAIESDDIAVTLVGTEITMIAGEAAQDYYFANSVAYGTWQTEQDTKVCVVCRGNADAGRVRIGEPYPSGHTQSPAHTRCRCAVVPGDY